MRIYITLLVVIRVLADVFVPCFGSEPEVSFADQSAYFSDSDRAEKVQATAATVENLFKEYADSMHTPGFVYGIVLDGKLLYSGNFGYANLEQRIPANTQSLFRIASMSKSVTAMAILQLSDAGKLNLDDPAAKYFPEMKQIKPLTTDAPPITIRHLLTHGAGFPEDNPWGDRQLARSDEELRQFIGRGISFSTVPGTAYEYSNLGFAILGQIVQNVSGMDFQEYTIKKILQPLGMNATVWEYQNAPETNLALGYDWTDGAYQNIPLEHHGSFGAMGGLITSIDDFTNYIALHLSAWPPRNDPENGPLRRSSLREMHQPWRFTSLRSDFHYPNGRKCAAVNAYTYGLAWMQDCDGKVYIRHSGGLPGFGSNWTMLPDYGLAVMSFTNKTYEAPATMNLAVLDTIITLAGLKPRTLPVPDILEKRKNELVRILPDWHNAENSGLFAENFFMDHRLPDLVKLTQSLYHEAGKITKVGVLQPMNQLRGTFILEGEQKNIEVYFTLTPEKAPLIQQVRMTGVNK